MEDQLNPTGILRRLSRRLMSWRSSQQGVVPWLRQMLLTPSSLLQEEGILKDAKAPTSFHLSIQILPGKRHRLLLQIMKRRRDLALARLPPKVVSATNPRLNLHIVRAFRRVTLRQSKTCSSLPQLKARSQRHLLGQKACVRIWNLRSRLTSQSPLLRPRWPLRRSRQLSSCCLTRITFRTNQLKSHLSPRWSAASAKKS